ncbi:MAG: ribosomal RNA small subunit methyltransferase A [Spirochaetes bacterium]|nr:ribosomal RNA small subunit methyltransferase A [Spirochaetota bacterium]
MNIYAPREITALLESHGLALSKQRGQNFLTDMHIAQRIAAAIDEPAASAVEIGPGIGALTIPLAGRYAGVSAVEFDRGLFQLCTEIHTALPNVSFIHADILEYELPGNSPVDVCGNIPYNITSPILEWLLITNAGRWHKAAFMVQKDFALRLAASPGDDDYSALTLLLHFAAVMKKKFDVPRSVFYPAPTVDSSVITLTPHTHTDMKLFPLYRAVVKSLFHSRRKTAHNNLIRSPYLAVPAALVEDAFRQCAIPARERGERLSFDQVYGITRIFSLAESPAILTPP